MTHYNNWADLGIIDGVKHYLYGDTTPDDDYSVRLRDEATAGEVITVSLDSFMTTGPGRYAGPFLMGVVQEFFDTSHAIADGIYSLADMLTELNLTGTATTARMQQYGIDIFSSDYDQRAFLWGTTQFDILSASFSVVADIRVITSITIAAATENFDFQGGPGTGAANAILGPLVDPYEIGHQVIINFTGNGATTTDYTAGDFATDVAHFDDISVSSAVWQAKLATLNAVPFIAEIKDDPYTSFFEDDRNVVYGSNEKDDVLVAEDPTFLDTMDGFHGFTLVGGKGADYIGGWTHEDLLVGGDGEDIILGNFDRDELQGQAGNDLLVGGNFDGLDRTIDMEVRHQDWDDGEGDTLKGGFGNDRYLIYHENGATSDWRAAGSSILEVIDTIDERDGDGRGTILLQTHRTYGSPSGQVSLIESLATAGVYEELYTDDEDGTYYWNSTAQVGDGEEFDNSAVILVSNLTDENGERIIFLMQSYPAIEEPTAAIVGFKQGDFGIQISGYSVPQAPGSESRDHLGDSDDTAAGGTGSDDIRGNGGNDTISGDDGDDYINGGSGSDVLSGGNGNDEIDGADGSDIAAFAKNRSEYTVVSMPDGTFTILDNDFRDVVSNVEVFRFLDGDVTASTLQSYEIVGSGSDDTQTGTSGNDTIKGLAGNDTLFGVAGNDYFSGGTGDDVIFPGDGKSVVDGGDGSDTVIISGNVEDFDFGVINGSWIEVHGSTLSSSLNNVEWLVFDAPEGTDDVSVDLVQLLQSAQATSVDGTEGNDELTGTNGYDTIHGKAGDDTIFGLGNNDNIDAGSGDDVVLGGAGKNTIEGGDGSDTVIIAGLQSDFDVTVVNGSWVRVAGADQVNLIHATEWIVFDGPAENDETSINVSSLLDANNSTQIDGSSTADTLTGTVGHDTIRGYAGDDTIFGLEGNDIIDAGDGDDVVFAGSGYNQIDGANGSDTVIISGRQSDYSIVAIDGTKIGIVSGDTVNVISNAEWIVFDAPDGEEDTSIDVVDFLAQDSNNEAAQNDLVALEGANEMRAPAPIELASADIIAFPSSSVSAADFDANCVTSYEEIQATSEVAGSGADVVSLADFVAALQDDNHSSDLWFEPEPIGAII
ncbi:calcium-binding protein [Rhizobium sp. WSM1325]|uniref:calcium-binding protein n=1 Tax=Rhizobium sp. WSM1325 TaxID=3444086 RepID=UPI000FF7356C|nr:calcium-binding protein [Rhizobium leguminosarum]RWY68276.1 calcium-binding protein [Rhizobium leguminosarum]